MAYLLALGAALLSATAMVLQRLALETAPAESAMRLRLLTHALRRGVWLAGFALLLGQFGLQASALRFGQLSVVQPVLTTELLFLVAILGVVFHRRLGWREWAGAAAMVGGLAAFFLSAAPHLGHGTPTGTGWLASGLATAVAAGALVAGAFHGPRWWRAAAFGAAGAVLFAFNAELTKALTTLVTHGWGHVFVSWVPYALGATGLGGLFLLQNALHAGPITASRAAQVTLNPLVSIAFGVAVFAERLRSGPGPLAGEVAGLVLLCAGVVLLAASPLVAGGTGADERLGRPAAVPAA